jgi:hypothetical protein
MTYFVGDMELNRQAGYGMFLSPILIPTSWIKSIFKITDFLFYSKVFAQSNCHHWAHDTKK